MQRTVNIFRQLSGFFTRHIIWPLETFGYLLYDSWRYARYSGMISKRGASTRRDSRILAACHVLEKGLAFPEPKRPYGQTMAHFVCDCLKNPDQRPSDAVTEVAVATLLKYAEYHSQRGFELGSLSEDIAAVTKSGATLPAGVRKLTRSDCEVSGRSFAALMRERKSVRQFSAPPERQQIERAVELAIKTPSACNRQCWRVYWTANPQLCKEIAALHSGSRGFGPQVPSWLVVSVDIAAFSGPRERAAANIDGGMFTMSLLLALTEIGLVSCPLNWSTPPGTDRRLHTLLDITPSENVVLLIAVGKAPDAYEVPISPRLPLEHFLKVR